MTQTILAVNGGSSSLKCKLFDVNKEVKPLIAIEISGLNSKDPASVEVQKGEKKDSHEAQDVKTHDDAFSAVLQLIEEDTELPSLKDYKNVRIAHRIVHGGDFDKHVTIAEDTLHYLEKLEALAPLHNASALAIIKSCRKQLPDVENVAFFDTVFHSTLPAAVRTYAIDQEIAKEKGLRKYGFHGISYQSILRNVSAHLQKKPEDTSLIVLHLGSGASACAIQGGKSIETSMGLTPVSGLPGSSRTGDIDPSLVFHLTSEAGQLSSSSTKELHITKAEEILNKQSGWKALAGTSDFSKIGNPENRGQESPQTLAFEIFVDRILSFIGSYYLKLESNVDALVFSGGIGEKSAYLRDEVTKRCKCLGFQVDAAKNDSVPESGVFEISQDGSKKVLVCHTDEEEEMAISFHRST